MSRGGGNAIRGSRVGAGPIAEVERGEAAPRMSVRFYCSNGHETRPAFALDAPVPEEWGCPRGGRPARTVATNPPPAHHGVPARPHPSLRKPRPAEAEAQAP